MNILKFRKGPTEDSSKQLSEVVKVTVDTKETLKDLASAIRELQAEVRSVEATVWELYEGITRPGTEAVEIPAERARSGVATYPVVERPKGGGEPPALQPPLQGPTLHPNLAAVVAEVKKDGGDGRVLYTPTNSTSKGILEFDDNRVRLTVEGVAERLDVNKSSVYRFMKTLSFPAPYWVDRYGRRNVWWLELEVDGWLNAHPETQWRTTRMARFEDAKLIPHTVKVDDETGTMKFVLQPEAEAGQLGTGGAEEIETVSPAKKVVVAGARPMQDFRAVASLTYRDLESGIFKVYITSYVTQDKAQKPYRSGIYRELGSQSLDMFRDGNTIGQIRLVQRKADGSQLSIEGTISRIGKAIMKLGTERERRLVGFSVGSF